FERFPDEIEPVELRIALLEMGNDAQSLRVVVEAAIWGEALVEGALTGVAEWRMAEIVRERECFAQVLVEPKRAGKRSRDLRDFQSVRQTRAIMVALVIDEHLCLVRKAAKRGRMDD